ncbi:MAG TPA: hypothetical protein VF169_17675 [Albitalea sp.]|uniref:hypothetical protein n=1 Tax=Piscinibacter sp. TaxID=1903157 RepID=UPI002ED6383E
MVSLIAFVMTGYGMNPYLVATFNSGLACEYAKSQIVAAALEQTNLGTSTYSMTPRTMKCMNLPGLVAGGHLPPDASPPPKVAPAAAAPKKPPVKK